MCIKSSNIFYTIEDFSFYYVKPKDEKTYTKRLTSGFVENPNNYGKL